MGLIQDVIRRLSEFDGIASNALAVSIYMKSRSEELLGFIDNSVFSCFVGYLNDDEPSLPEKKDVSRSLTFSFAPAIICYAHTQNFDRVAKFIDFYKKEIFSSIILAIVNTGSQRLFEIFVEKYRDLTKKERGLISYILALDEIALRFSIDRASPFVVDEYHHLSLDEKPFQIKQAALSTISAISFLVENDKTLCQRFKDALDIDSSEIVYFKLYPLLAKNLYCCEERSMAIQTFYAIKKLANLAIRTVGLYRFIVPPSPKEMMFALTENVYLIREIATKFGDFSRSDRFFDNKFAYEYLMEIHKKTGDPRIYLLANRFRLRENQKQENVAKDIIRFISNLPEDTKEQAYQDLGSIFINRYVSEDFEKIILEHLLTTEQRYLKTFAYGAFIEALKIYVR